MTQEHMRTLQKLLQVKEMTKQLLLDYNYFNEKYDLITSAMHALFV